MKVYVKKQNLKGTITVPGSKSHTIRSVLLSAMAKGTSVITNPLASNDCLSSVAAARAFGAKVTLEPKRWIIEGCAGNLMLPENCVDTQNSGTTTSLIMGMAGLCKGTTIITGDEQIRRRPVKEFVSVLNELGAAAKLTSPERNAPPVIIEGVMKGGTAHLSGFFSQFVSSILLSAPLLKNKTTVLVEKPLEKPYLQMSLDWIKKYGGKVTNSSDYSTFEIEGNQKYTAQECTIPSDWSGVAFPLVAAVITESDVTISGVDFDDCQGDKEVVQHLIKMGADIKIDKKNHCMHITGGKKLHSNLEINLNDIPDSLPALTVAACFAEGKTQFTGLAHVRVKETDRVAVMSEVLTKCGADVEIGPDYMIITGGKPLHGAEINSYDDHRVAMAMAVCGLWTGGTMVIDNAECASVSFPGFYELMNEIGADFCKK